jgi:hypothetical protein
VRCGYNVLEMQIELAARITSAEEADAHVPTRQACDSAAPSDSPGARAPWQRVYLFAVALSLTSALVMPCSDSRAPITPLDSAAHTRTWLVSNVSAASAELAAPEVSARSADAPAATTSTASAILAEPSVVPADDTTSDLGPFADRDERALREHLRSDPIVSVKKGSGGRSFAFKIQLQSGIAGYFKLEQPISSAHWYAEVAAYHLDRALGLGRVPAVVSRAVSWSSLAAAAGDDPRCAGLSIRPDGKVRGALVHWLNETLTPARTPHGWESWLGVEPFDQTSVSPFQSSPSFRAALQRAHDRRSAHLPPQTFFDAPPVPDRPELPAELSDMIVFDFLTLNYDRFGGKNINMLALGAAGPLIFLDNGDGFSAGPPRRGLLDKRLAPLTRFRKRTIDALYALDMHDFEARLATETLAPILNRRALAGLAARREIVLEHVAALYQRYGDAIFPW